MTDSITSVTERVRKGAALLDQKRPGWDNLIDIDNLNMRDMYACIVGQVFGEYGKGLKILEIPRDYQREAALHGFSSLGLSVQPISNDYANLKHAWIELILERRGA